MLFTFEGRESGPLLETPRARLILARGGAYAEDLPTPPSRFDHQKSYLEFWMSFIGVREVRTLVVREHLVGGHGKREVWCRARKGSGEGVGRTFLNHQIVPGRRKQWSTNLSNPGRTPS